MSEPLTGESDPVAPGARLPSAPSGGARRTPPAAQYAASLLFVAVATVLAFVVEQLIAAPNLTLLFVLPVVIAATSFGWGPALAAAVTGVLAFDFFFTEPLYSFRITSPSDLWATGLLLAIAAIVSGVAAESRRRSVEARQAAGQAQALQALAHVVIEARPRSEILQAAAIALNRIFDAPAVIFMEQGRTFSPVATAGAPGITAAEEEAARGSLASQAPIRAEMYPYDRSKFDIWPVATPAGFRCAVGVDFTRAGRERPAAPERAVEVVVGYLAAAFAPK
jgi:K+-sensing histidine kinase KdpD